MASKKPIIMFVHGAWHTLEHYRVFLAILQSKGYTVIAPDLPSRTVETVVDPTKADIELIASIARNSPTKGKGFGLGIEARRSQGLNGGVRRIVIVAGFILEKGVCIETSAPIDSLDWCYYEGSLKVIDRKLDAGPFFYPDISHQDQQSALRRLVKHPKACSFYSPENKAYTEIDTTFVYCGKVMAFPQAAQRDMIMSLKDRRVKVDEESLPSGHFPSLSMPDRLAEIVLKYCA
ncbi:hypothetical protein QBC33DRAFT_585125 [Phialemonium atrogriseum]|uniref:AB hydrolase-1 domain-containing protein n=1 Tax=Phialemonium atrogriseum TaxID=1093897 RepID=A0AAJ0C5R5_9PEZI|nr:uncharacterized protein QBC33DRAFT_585125 [Phialemonium atrogriseum]KAK1768171.1 hypothetical protein QBC33DRAFT_585125 [Phialemonium atrogriseum]